MKKRIVSLLLVFCMVITLVPANVLADEVKGLAETTAGQTQTAGTTAAKPENPFADVKSGSWYEAAVLYARANGFFDGTSATTFEPDGPMTRAMFVTVLGRMAGVEAADYAGATDFIDVAEGTWYAPFVKWAARYGITTGTGNGKFSPDGRITREEMAVFFVRYFETFDAMPKADTTVTTKPADLDKVSSWAQDAVLKLWALGLLNGDGVNFAPKDKATRAQTAALCQRTDKAVETWYSEPGVKSERVSVEPGSGQESGDKKPEEQKPSGGGSSGGTTVTTYYTVSFEVEGAPMSPATVEAGTRISSLSTPTVEGKVFLGWYYDSALTRAAGTNDTVNQDMTLYAKLGEVMAVNANEAETPNYVTVTVPAANVSGYTFGIRDYAEGCIDSFINVTANNEAVSYNVPNGTVSFAPQQGQTYRVELTADSDARFVVDGAEQAPSVRVLNIVTEKDEVDNLTLSGGVKYIPKKDVTGMSTSLDGLFRTSLNQDENGNTQPVTPVEQTGSFTYAAGGLAVGDTVAIYEGVSPADRSIRTDNDGAVAYVQITAASGTTYTYKTADSADVLFTPDVLPFPTDQGWDTDGNADNDAATVRVENMTYTDDQYTEMGLDSQTTIDVGDFLAFYTGSLGGESQSRGYARITHVETVTQDGEEYYVLTYEDAEEADVFAAMDLYSTRDEEIELTAAQRAEIEDDMVRQARESGFAEQAAQYLTELALETDGFQELSDMGLSSYSITDADGALVQSCDLTLYSAVSRPLLDKDHINISATVNVGSLKHFADRYGIRAELSIEFSTTVEGKNGNSIEINMTAVFEQEVLLTVNTSGGAIWKWKWIFPYIYDYRLNANIDVGTYTGIAITATAKTAGGDDDGFDWKSVTGLAPEEKIINIGQQIKDLMEQKESFFGEDVDWKAGEGGGLADKYSAMMEDADESWIDLVRKEIFAQEGNVDPFHILCYGISADFVVKANLYVTMGMSFEFGVARRYNFSILLFHKQSTNETIDLEEAHYNFDFYVMGTLGVRVGVEFEIGVGLFSLKLDSIGITAEAGAYAQLWGYFYYHLSWTQSGGKESNAAGAMTVTKPGYALSWSPALPETMPQSDSTYTAVWTAKGDTAYTVEHYQQNADDDGYTLHDTDPLTGATDAEVTAAARNYDHFVLNESAAGTVSSGVIAADGSLVLRLYYDRETLRVTFDAGEGGTLTDSAEKDFRYGQRFSVSAPTRPDYSFMGWKLPEGSVFNAETVTESMTLTASWGAQPVDFTVEHYYMDTAGKLPGRASESNASHAEADSAVELGTLKKSGLSEAFTCVKAKVSGVYGLADDTEFTDLSETVRAAKDMTVKLYYDRARYALAWEFDGGTADNDYTGRDDAYGVYYDTELIAPAPTRRGHDFLGWFDDEGSMLAAGAKMPAKAQTYCAKWTPSVYDITYGNVPSGSFGDAAQPEKHTYGTATAIPDLTRTGYIFDGWVVNGTGAARKGLTLGAEDYTGAIALTAAWTAERYPITYAGMDGAQLGGKQPTEYAYDTDTAVSDPTKAGYTFLGWLVNGSGTAQKALTLAKESYTGAITLTATWEQNPYKITWNVNEGDELTGEGYTVEAFYGNPITAPSDPTRRGYTFGGWYTDGSNFAENTKFTDGGAMPDHNVTFYAKWTAIPYKITYELDGGTNVSGNPAQYTVETGKIKLVAPTKMGYAFEGWYSDAERTDRVAEIAAGSTGDVTLYAKWTINQYTVTWETNGGNDPTGSNYTTTADYGTAIVRPDDPTKEADAQYTYTFGGWYTDRALTQPLDDNATVPAENLTVYAKWNTTAQTYTVKWYGVNNPWWGSAAKKEPYVLLRTDTYDYGTLLLKNAPETTKDAYDAYYYELEGWRAGSETGELLTEASIVTGDAEYYPSFRQKITMCTITFDLGDAGGTIDPVTVEYGTFSSSVFDKIQKPDTMARYGQFKGWYEEGESHMGQDYRGRIVRSMTVQAGWSELYAYDEDQLRAALSEGAYQTSTVRLRANIALADEVPITKTITVTGEPLTTDNKDTNYTLTAAEGKTAFRIGKTTLTDITARPTVTIENLTIHGGARGLLVYIADVNLENVTIENCDATTDTHSTKISNGGAIYMDTKNSFGTVTSRLCTFRNNKAYNGGAIYIKKGALETNGCKFLGNTATSDGGAVMLTDNAQQSGIGAGTFQNNHAGGYGGALYVGRVRVSLSLVTFDTGNTAGTKGKLIVIYTSLDKNNNYVSYTDCWDKTQSADKQYSDNLYSSKGGYVTRDKL